MKESIHQTTWPKIDREKCIEKIQIGKQLDVACLAGRRGGTAFLPVDSERSLDLSTSLNETATLIPTGTTAARRNAELRNPRAIPIVEFNKFSSGHYWNWVRDYVDLHLQDGAPRLFGEVDVQDIPYYNEMLKQHLETDKGLSLRRAIDIPLFANAKSYPDVKSGLRHIQDSHAQGMLLHHRRLVEKAMQLWDDTAQSDSHARPFIGLQGTTDELLDFMKSTAPDDARVDSLIFSDVPDASKAKQIQKAHIRRMQKAKSSRQLTNPHFREGEPSEKIAIINVQGGARMDAAALITAAEHSPLNIEVHLVENGEQLTNLDPNCIVLPGGWHGIQYRLHETLKLKPVIVDMIRDTRRRKHVLALCAGSILTRDQGNDTDVVLNHDCQPGSYCIGNYKVKNNIINSPADVHVMLHYMLGRNLSTVLRQMPFSNAPIFEGVDESIMNVIARLCTTEFAMDIEEDDGSIVGVQRKQPNVEDPVRIAAAFHDSFVFTLFLNELHMFKVRQAQHRQWQIEEAKCHRNELGALGLPFESTKNDSLMM